MGTGGMVSLALTSAQKAAGGAGMGFSGNEVAKHVQAVGSRFYQQP